jgi:chromosome transmission fidelity protein 18
MRQQIIDERARKKQNSVQTVPEDFEFSRTLLAPPISSGFVNIKPSNNGTQYYLRKRMDKDSGFDVPRSAVENSFYPNFKKLKIEALKSLAKKKVKAKDTQQHYVDTSGELLVSKYAPNHFTSLLSDTGVNRILLKWLQLWDHCVFGKPKPKKPEDDDDQTNEEKQQQQSFGNQKYNKFGPNSEKTKWGEHKFTPKKPYDPLLEEYDFDKAGRPKHKIVLLAGPAGLGKTTLAHVAAKHLGYKVSEINSSDDRSAKTIKETIKKHLSSADVRDGMAEERTGIMHKTKPCCLVLDEIDGADSRAIDVVCQLVNSQPKAKGKGKKIRSERRRYASFAKACDSDL